jgi:hypothetical protein
MSPSKGLAGRLPKQKAMLDAAWNALPSGQQPIATYARMASSKGLEKRTQHGLASSVSFQQVFGGPSPKRQRRERRLRTSWRRSRSGQSPTWGRGLLRQIISGC